MNWVADLHLHSHYSRATSKDLTFEHLWKWAQIKGVHIVGTGDIAHPGWLEEMQKKLEPAEEGLFRLTAESAAAMQPEVPAACQGTVRFMLAGEISNIYKRHDAVRKIHNVIFAPSLEAVAKIQAELEKIGNIRSDGRPILGLDSRDLFEIILNVDERCHLIPAHIWTPWFSLLGSKSGFDAVEACFDDLTPHIFALETGLSSDPPMNWRVSALDRYTLVSNSDAHSPQKLAREATLFDTALTYDALFEALKTGDPATFKGTIEFFPEEGKYHLDGHRKCGVCWHPQTTRAHDGRCSVCAKPVTVGVMHRVETLADRPEGERPARTHPFHSLIPLPEILGEINNVGANTKTVAQAYLKLLNRLGAELAILREIPLAEIEAAGGLRLAEGIERMRRGEVTAKGGYDGEYGVVKLFEGVDTQVSSLQMGLLGLQTESRDDKAGVPQRRKERKGRQEEAEQQMAAVAEPGMQHGDGERQFSITSMPQQVAETPASGFEASPHHPASVSADAIAYWLDQLNDPQREAVRHSEGPLVIVAGPGTGKTRTLTVRLAYLIGEKGVDPAAILAITFTNKAAEEMAERLAGMVGVDVAARATIKTFHAFGTQILREHGAAIGLDPHFVIATDEDRERLLRHGCSDLAAREVAQALDQISAAKNQMGLAERSYPTEDPFPAIYRRYEEMLRENHALDFDDLILQTVRLFETCPEVLQTIQDRFRWISVDEYQDVNLAQYRLLRLLAGDGAAAADSSPSGRNLCVIGDPDQAIYGFRGADHRFFLAFANDYPGAKTLHLSQNYRSTQLILNAATQVIAQNPDRAALELFSSFVAQVKLDVYRAPTDRAEAEYVVHQIEQMVGGTSYFSLDSGRVDDDTLPVERSFADFAVLYRLNAQSRLLQEAFDRSGIPYQTVGQLSFYARKPVQMILAHLWLLHNPRSRLHWERVLSVGERPPTAAILDNLMALIGSASGSWEEILQKAMAADGIDAGLRQQLAGLSSLHRLCRHDPSQPVSSLVEKIHSLMATRAEGALAAGDLRRLVQRAEPFGDGLSEFLASTALQREADAYDPRADRVTLMTLHAAKGLEFPVVFVVGCEEGLLPYLPENKAVNVEEERRLFYVGMTRAQRKLILTHAHRRLFFGQWMENAPSRFVGDIERALVEMREAQQRAKPPKPENVQLSLF